MKPPCRGELLPDHVADHLAVAAVVELRDEVEGDDDLASVGGEAEDGEQRTEEKNDAK